MIGFTQRAHKLLRHHRLLVSGSDPHCRQVAALIWLEAVHPLHGASRGTQNAFSYRPWRRQAGLDNTIT